MHFDPEYWLTVAVLISIIALASFLISSVRSRSRRRANDLRQALTALDAHYDAVSALVDDPALSLEAKAFLVRFTEAISDQESAEALAASFAEEVPAGSENDKLIEHIRHLAKTRPDLVEQFHIAMASGIVALFLRWPKNRAFFQAATVAMASDSRVEKALPRRVIEITRKQNGPGRGGMIGPTPIAAAC